MATTTLKHPKKLLRVSLKLWDGRVAATVVAVAVGRIRACAYRTHCNLQSFIGLAQLRSSSAAVGLARGADRENRKGTNARQCHCHGGTVVTELGCRCDGRFSCCIQRQVVPAELADPTTSRGVVARNGVGAQRDCRWCGGAILRSVGDVECDRNHRPEPVLEEVCANPGRQRCHKAPLRFWQDGLSQSLSHGLRAT